METHNIPECIPTKEELTQLVDGFAETVKRLMDLRNTPTETSEDVKQRHRNDNIMDYHFARPKSVFEFYRKLVLEDGTEIRLAFNLPDKSSSDGKTEVKIEVTSLPTDSFIRINRLKNARFRTVRVSNYSVGGDSRSTLSSERILPGFQLLAEDCNGEEFDIDGSKDYLEKNFVCREILHELHKLIVKAMYQPYKKPARMWFQKLFS